MALGCIILGVTSFSDTTIYELQSPHVFILNLSESMNTQDALDTHNTRISRLEAAKHMIQDSLSPSQPIGLIGCNESICQYLIPPTIDTDYIHNYLTYVHTQMLRKKSTSFDTKSIQGVHLTYLDGGNTAESPTPQVRTLLKAGQTNHTPGIPHTTSGFPRKRIALLLLALGL